MESREDVEQAIAHWEHQERRAKEILPHLRAILAAFDGGSVSSNGGKKQRSRVSRAPKNAFEAKYDKPAGALALNVLRSLSEGEDKAGLSLREISDRLAAEGKEFSDQAMRLAVKKLVEDRKALKIRAPKSSAAKHHYRANPNYAENFPDGWLPIDQG